MSTGLFETKDSGPNPLHSKHWFEQAKHAEEPEAFTTNPVYTLTKTWHKESENKGTQVNQVQVIKKTPKQQQKRCNLTPQTHTAQTQSSPFQYHCLNFFHPIVKGQQ